MRAQECAERIPVNQLDECARCACVLRVLPQSTLRVSTTASAIQPSCMCSGVRCKCESTRCRNTLQKDAR
eukprot:10738934-Alexandrium_andersonii.AAC.1